MPLLSIVVPCHNEQESLPLLYEKLVEVIQTMRETDFSSASSSLDQTTVRDVAPSGPLEFELVFIDDGSQDETLATIQSIEKNDRHDFLRVKWLSFSRNFGKEAALYAGLESATGDFVVTMDSDMQDPPDLLPEMYQILISNDEYDSVAAYRVDRKGESRMRSFFSKMFYRLMNRLSDTEIKDGARDYRLMRRSMVNAILSLSEYNRFSKGIFNWVGFNTKWIPFENTKRVAGKTSWSMLQLFSYATEGIVSFSTKPLQIASITGVLFFLMAIIVLIFIIVRTLVFGDPVSGWPSMICIMLFIGGLQLLCMGIFGQYLAKSYMETKNRPIFIVRRSNFDSPDE